MPSAALELALASDLANVVRQAVLAAKKQAKKKSASASKNHVKPARGLNTASVRPSAMSLVSNFARASASARLELMRTIPIVAARVLRTVNRALDLAVVRLNGSRGARATESVAQDTARSFDTTYVTLIPMRHQRSSQSHVRKSQSCASHLNGASLASATQNAMDLDR